MFEFSFTLFDALKMKNINKENKNENKKQMVKGILTTSWLQLAM